MLQVISEAEFAAAKRRRDPNGLVQPWFTHPALDVIERWDLKGKCVLEWGAGLSTIWWAERVGSAGTVITIEHVTSDPLWGRLALEQTRKHANVELHIRGERTGLDPTDYVRPPDGHWDVVVVDGEPCHLRTACIASALAMPRPLWLIVDNWQQDFVFIDEAAVEMMKPYHGQLYVQPDHTDHDGRPWCTAIWRLE